MKRYLAIFLAVLMMIPTFAMAEGVVKIGVFEPASGDSGAGGKQEMLGMQYANTVQPTVEIGGETYKVELVYADNGSSTDKAPSAAQQLVSEGVSVVLGSYGSGVSIAGSQYFADAGIPAIGVTCTNPQVTAGNSHYFQQAFEAMGGMVISDTFPTGNSDFTSYLSNATAIGAEVFFCPVSIAYSSQIISQAAGQNVSYPILGSDTLDNNKVAEAAKGTNVKVIITTFYQEGGSPEFDEGFKAWLNSDSEYLTNNGGNDMISAVSVMGYDAYFTALEALKAAGSTDSKAVLAALPSVKLTGVTGEIAFDETGDAIRDSAYIKSVNTETGAWDFVAVQTVE